MLLTLSFLFSKLIVWLLYVFLTSSLWIKPFGVTLSNSTSSILISLDHFYIVLYLLGNSKLRICSSIPMV